MNNKQVASLLLAGSLLANTGASIVYASSAEEIDNGNSAVVSNEDTDVDAASETQVQTAEEPIETETVESLPEAKKNAVVLNREFFPDNNFRALISKITNIPEGEELTEETLGRVTEINGSGQGIENAKGLEHFKQLVRLDLSNNQLKSIDLVDKFKMTHLNLSNNQLNQIDLSDARNVAVLDLSNNQLASVDLLPVSEVVEMDLSNNRFTNISLAYNKHLEHLKLHHNQLTEIDLAANLELKNFDAGYNQIVGIGLSRNTKLETLNLKANQLSMIDLTQNINLTQLNLSENLLSAIDLSQNKQLIEVEINHQQTVADVRNKVVFENGSYSLDLSSIIFLSNVKEYAVNNYSVTNNMVHFGSAVPESIEVQAVLPNGNASFRISLVFGEQTEIALTKQFFPDDNFRKVISEITNVSENEALPQYTLDKVTSIAARNKNIQNIKGVEYFKNLNELDLMGNKLRQVDLSQNTELTRLVLSGNQITDLNITNNKKLTFLHTAQNQLRSIDLSQNTELYYLTLSANNLNKIDLQNNAKLTELSLRENQLSAVDLSNNIELKTAYLDDNRLELIDISKNAKLEILNVSKNQLETIDFQFNPNLKVLYADKNQLKTVDVQHNPLLEELSFKNNLLTSIDVSQNKNLSFLYLAENSISQLDLSENKNLQTVNVQDQKVTIDVTDIVKHNINGYTLDLKDILGFKNENGFILSNITAHSYTEPSYVVTNNSVVGLKEEVPDHLMVTAEFSSDYNSSCFASFTIRLHYNKNDRIKLTPKFFPDSQFRALLIKEIGKPEGSLLLQEDFDRVEELVAANYKIHGINNVRGIEYFTKLKKLDLSDNKIQSINLTKNTELQELVLYSNQLRDLDLSHNPELVIVDVENNQLEQLDVSNNVQLNYLVVQNNNLQSINLEKNEKLMELHAGKNRLREIDLSQNKQLETVYLSENKLNHIDLSHNEQLLDLDLRLNELTEVDLSHNPNLQDVDVSNNRLNSLKLSDRFAGNIAINNQFTNTDASKSVYWKDESYCIDLNKVFHIDTIQKSDTLFVQSFEVNGYQVSDGIAILGETVPKKLEVKAVLSNNQTVTIDLTITGEPPAKPDNGIDWTPIGPSTPIKPDNGIDWTPIGPSTPIKPDNGIDWIPIGPSTPIKPDNGVDWTPIGPSTSIKPNQSESVVLPSVPPMIHQAVTNTKPATQKQSAIISTNEVPSKEDILEESGESFVEKESEMKEQTHSETNQSSDFNEQSNPQSNNQQSSTKETSTKTNPFVKGMIAFAIVGAIAAVGVVIGKSTGIFGKKK